MLKKPTIFIITFILIISCSKKSQGLKTSDLQTMMSQFLSNHAFYHTLNDEISERILKNYLNSLDHNKYYFYKKDIDLFNKDKNKIDNYLQEKKYKFIFNIFDVYKKRFKEKMLLFKKLLKNKYNFTIDEEIIVDREKIKYALTTQEMQERWRKNIKLQLLNYISADSDLKTAKEKLKKKYDLIFKRMREIDEEKILTQFLNSFSTALDPHSNYLSQDQHEDFKISMELKLEGIGARLSSKDGFVVVESIIPGGATDKLPKNRTLKPNDKIVAVAQAKGEPVDVIDMDLRDVVKKIRGKKGTEVRLTIIRDSEDASKSKRLIIPIIREEIKLQDSDAESDVLVFDFQGEKVKIGYINLPSFYQDHKSGKSSADDIKLHTNKLQKQKVKAIILDLRNNPGGLLNEAVKIAGLYIDQGPVVQIKNKESAPKVIYDFNKEIFYKGPLVILINKFSASASEILSGAIKDYKRGIIIGPRNTFGKGTVQSYKPLDNKKGAVKITTHIFYQPSGSSNQLNGIKPDLIVPAISSIWDVGEEKTLYPLKWTKIPAASFKTLPYASKDIIAKLDQNSNNRISKNKKFKDLLEKIKDLKKKKDEKTISLKQEEKAATPKADSEESGETTDATKNNNNKKEKEDNKDKEKKIIDLENDPFLKEAFNITAEYIEILNPTKSADKKKAEKKTIKKILREKVLKKTQ